MNKKVLYSILSTIVAMIVLSVSLVFAIGPRVSADEAEEGPKIGVLDKAEYFNIDENNVLCGLSNEGSEYANQFDLLTVIVPDGVIEVRGFHSSYAGYYSTAFGAFSWCDDDYLYDNTGSFYRYNYATGKVIDVVLPNSLETIGSMAFYNASNLQSITIPANVSTIASGFSTYSQYVHVFTGSDLIEIIVQNPDLLTNENLQPYADIMRYEVPQYTVTFDTVCGNVIDNQNVTKNGNAVEPTAPTKDGYTFKGWLLNGEPYDFTTPVTEDMTLTAKWEAVQTQPETPAEENDEINNQNNTGLIWGIAGTSAGVLIIAGVVIGIVINKRRHK